MTEQVLARQRVEQFNQELEDRVLERTRQVAAAQATTECERAQLQALIAQAPVPIGLFAGEELRVTSANAAISTLWGYPPEHVVGRPLLEAIPELQGQGFDDLLRQVLHTQVPFIGTEMPALLRWAGQLHTTYFNFVYQPLYEADGQVTSVLCLAADVTAQVLARQQLEVQDNGLGLDLVQGQERLFAMFQRLHTHVEGTGVCLYMAKRILENAGGRIEVDSQLGQGSTFRVYFKR